MSFGEQVGECLRSKAGKKMWKNLMIKQLEGPKILNFSENFAFAVVARSDRRGRFSSSEIIKRFRR